MSSLYRKWRSRSFDDLYGQDHVVRTLRHAVSQGRVAHAYLFTGPRGTGKTSTARILAKAVNCLSPRDGNPCNECEMCRAADEGRALDVIEIDAASNTSVENVRDLRERVAYAAGEARFKVYIVDEVHRLSGAAFDAFLKTLEEPPEHVIFVFASTEPHKVPATIMSRCQRFDFRRIPPQETFERLSYVASQESLETSEDALRLLAQAGNGSLRDALGLLDQVASYTDGRISDTDVRQALGLIDPLLVGRLADHLLSGNVGAGLGEAAGFVEAGGDPGQLTKQFVEYWRAVLLRVSGAGDDAVLDPAWQESLRRDAGRVNPSQVVAVVRAMGEQSFSARYNLPPELPFEVGYVQASLALRPSAATGSPTPREEARPSRPAPPASRPAATAEAPSRQPPPAPRPQPASASSPTPQPPAPVAQADISNLDAAWDAIVANMRPRSRSLEALLKSGYLLRASDGQLTVGFLYPFHRDKLSEVEKRRLLEQVVGETLGAAYRVTCVVASREEIESARGKGVLADDDGFVEEVAERLRQYHVQQLGNGHS